MVIIIDIRGHGCTHVSIILGPVTKSSLHCCCRWKSDVSTYPGLDPQTEFGPIYSYEYNTRETYGGKIENWTENDPLNATWWHHVTEGMWKVIWALQRLTTCR
jgi:hypothetical protein